MRILCSYNAHEVILQLPRRPLCISHTINVQLPFDYPFSCRADTVRGSVQLHCLFLCSGYAAYVLPPCSCKCCPPTLQLSVHLLCQSWLGTIPLQQSCKYNVALCAAVLKCMLAYYFHGTVLLLFRNCLQGFHMGVCAAAMATQLSCSHSTAHHAVALHRMCSYIACTSLGAANLQLTWLFVCCAAIPQLGVHLLCGSRTATMRMHRSCSLIADFCTVALLFMC